MNKRSSAAYLALFIGLSVTLAGCGYMNQVRAMKAFKDGNKAYAASDWRAGRPTSRGRLRCCSATRPAASPGSSILSSTDGCASR